MPRCSPFPPCAVLQNFWKEPYPEAREELMRVRAEKVRGGQKTDVVSVCGYHKLFALDVVQTFVEGVSGILGPLGTNQEDYETARGVLKLLPPERFSELDKLRVQTRFYVLQPEVCESGKVQRQLAAGARKAHVGLSS